MAPTLLGRTNREFPSTWLTLTPPTAGPSSYDLSDTVAAALESKLPLDISRSPALFGGMMRGRSDTIIVQFGSRDIERATDSNHAADLVQAHLIETLSSIGREWIDIYFLASHTVLKENQISGALEALESARQDGNVRYLGLFCGGDPSATLANWHMHDAFELFCAETDQALQELAPMARQRRAGVLYRGRNEGKGAQVRLVPVQSRSEIECALHTPVLGAPA